MNLVFIPNTLLYTSMLILMSVGLVLIFGASRILNFAHAGFFALGVYLSYSFIKFFTPSMPLLILSPFLSGAIVAVAGLAFERLLLKWVYEREEVFQILLTFGGIYLLDGIIRMRWGGWSIMAAEPMYVFGKFAGYPIWNLMFIAFGFITIVILWILLFKTRTGKTIRMVASDEEMSSALGINVARTRATVFALGCFFAGFAGAMMQPLSGAMPGIGLTALIMAFVVIIVGGRESIKGALAASFIIAIARTIGIAFFPQIVLVLVYLILVVVLAVRPTGIFGGE